MVRRILFLFAALAAAWAGGIEYLRGRVGPQAAALATSWCPWDPGLWLDRAALEPEQARAWLDRAIAAERFQSSARIQRAGWAETDGDSALARRLLEEAAAADRRFASQWALLNFAFRQKDNGLFWRTAPHALQMSNRDRTALFELLWRQRPDGAWLASHLVGSHPPVLWQFSRFLSRKGDLRNARSVFRRLLDRPYLSPAHANAGPIATMEERRDLGLVLSDLSWDHGDPTSAAGIWNDLVERRLLPYRPAGPPHPPLQNPRFDFPPLRQGFDWRPLSEAGAQWACEPGGRFRWEGNPAGAEPVLSQHLALAPHREYRFHFRCSGTPSPEWRWEAAPPRSAAPVSTTSLGSCLGEGAYLHMVFPSGPDGFAQLRLVAPPRGPATYFTLDEFRLEPVRP